MHDMRTSHGCGRRTVASDVPVHFVDSYLNVNLSPCRILPRHFAAHAISAEFVCDLSNGTIFSDFEWPLTTFQGHAIFSLSWTGLLTVNDHRRPCSDFMDMLRRFISCRIIIIIIIIIIVSRIITDWLSKIFKDKEHRVASLRQLSFLCESVDVDCVLA